MNTISVCIPAYEMNGKAKLYLTQLLDSISIQKNINYNVLVSDNSSLNNDDVKQVCKNYKFVKLVDSLGEKTASSNTNNAILNSTGDIIKIMFADDFFFDDYSLFDSVKPVLEGNYWSCTACCHTNDGKNLHHPFFPKYHEEIHFGNNTMSSPSTITFRRDNSLLFDENIHYLMDVEWYKRMRLKHGIPHLNNRINVVNRIHEDSLTSQLTKQNLNDVKNKEIKYVNNKFISLSFPL